MPSQAIIVLGMHRSGTSALTGVLSILGADAGPKLLAPSERNNPKGFWEHSDFVKVHDELLNALGSGWHDSRLLPKQWWLFPNVKPFRSQIRNILDRDFSHSRLFVIKDPRLCRLIPLWLDTFSELSIEPRFIFCLRHPTEVARSLHVRDGISLERASLLWAIHLLESEENTRGFSRTFLCYENLLMDWHVAINRAASELDLPLDSGNAFLREKVEEFLEASLRHHIASACPASRCDITDRAIACYQAVLRNDIDDALGPRLDELRVTATNLMAGHESWSREIFSVRTSADEMRNQYESQLMQFRDEMCELQSSITRIKKTWSWQLTKPLRYLAKLVRRIR